MASVAQRQIAKSTTGSAQHDTYKIAHTARCKLHIAANRPDRNLRFILGHAFTLDNLLLRIVEIENSSAKDEFEDTKPDRAEPEIKRDNDRKAGIGGGAGVTVGEQGSLKREDKGEPPKRRISFGNSANFKPSDLRGAASNNGAKRNKSPPPAQQHQQQQDDDDDDVVEEDPTVKPQTAAAGRTNIDNPATDDADDEPVYDYDDGEDEEDDGLGLTRFASASAAPPRRRASPPPPLETDVPELDPTEEDDDDLDPPSPPSLPEDVTRKMVIEGEEDETMKGLYNQIKSCRCGGKMHEGAPVADKMRVGTWEGKTVGVVSVAA